MAKAPLAFLLHGFIGVGKTTFAKRLEQDQNALRFTHDEWMSRLYGIDPPEADFSKHADRISQLMEDMWTRCIMLGTNVVLDFGFWSRAQRDHVRLRVTSLGGKPVLYSLHCDDDVAWRRIADRNTKLAEGLFIARSTYHLLKSRFEPLAPEEERIEIET